MNPASAGSPKGRDAVGGSIREADDIAVGKADAPNPVGMTQDTPSIAAIVEGLSEAEKRAIRDARYSVLARDYFVEHTTHAIIRSLTAKRLLHKTDRGRLLKAGLAVRTALQEHSK